MQPTRTASGDLYDVDALPDLKGKLLTKMLAKVGWLEEPEAVGAAVKALLMERDSVLRDQMRAGRGEEGVHHRMELMHGLLPTRHTPSRELQGVV